LYISKNVLSTNWHTSISFFRSDTDLLASHKVFSVSWMLCGEINADTTISWTDIGSVKMQVIIIAPSCHACSITALTLNHYHCYQQSSKGKWSQLIFSDYINFQAHSWSLEWTKVSLYYTLQMYLLVTTAEEHMGQTSTAYKPNGKKPLERDSCRREDNIASISFHLQHMISH
jgi:hypothetical protein